MAKAGPSSHQGPVEDHELDGLFAPLLNAPHVLVAVSGGPDSVAALHLLARWQRGTGQGAVLSVATVDHGLRGTDSAREATDVASLCAGLGFPHATLAWLGDKPATRLQEAAREARYGLLLEHAARDGATHLVTGHTLDDQAETVLMRMSRGSGLAGLAGMRVSGQSGPVLHVRPFLGLAKERLVATCKAAGLAFALDPSNANAVYARPRWRKLMPVLAAEGLDSGRLWTLASRMARADDALTQRANVVFGESLTLRTSDCLVLNSGFLTQEPAEIALRVLGLALAGVAPACGGPSPYIRLERQESCLAALIAASEAGKGLSRTLQNCLVRLNTPGVLHVATAPARRRGMNENTSAMRASLGKAADGA